MNVLLPDEYTLMESGTFVFKDATNTWTYTLIENYENRAKIGYTNTGTSFKMYCTGGSGSTTHGGYVTSEIIGGLAYYNNLKIRVCDVLYNTNNYDKPRNDIIILASNGSTVDSKLKITSTGVYTFNISSVTEIKIQLVCQFAYSNSKYICIDQIIAF